MCGSRAGFPFRWSSVCWSAKAPPTASATTPRTRSGPETERTQIEAGAIGVHEKARPRTPRRRTRTPSARLRTDPRSAAARAERQRAEGGGGVLGSRRHDQSGGAETSQNPASPEMLWTRWMSGLVQVRAGDEQRARHERGRRAPRRCGTRVLRREPIALSIVPIASSSRPFLRRRETPSPERTVPRRAPPAARRSGLEQARTRPRAATIVSSPRTTRIVTSAPTGGLCSMPPCVSCSPRTPTSSGRGRPPLSRTPRDRPGGNRHGCSRLMLAVDELRPGRADRHPDAPDEQHRGHRRCQEDAGRAP